MLDPTEGRATMNPDGTSAEFEAIAAANKPEGDWMTTPPWAIRYRPVQSGDNIIGTRVVMAMRGEGLRSDLRAITNPQPPSTSIEVATEQNWYRNPAAPAGVVDVPHDDVLVEEEVPYPDDQVPPEGDPHHAEAMSRLRRTPADGSRWPLRLPTRALAADSLVGRRIIIRRLHDDRTWRDVRNHRAVSPIVPAQRDANEQMVRVIDEASWYAAPGDTSIPAVMGIEAFRVWVE
jgi:hypothetical protein